MARPEPSLSRWARLGLLLAVLAGLVFYGVGSGRLSRFDLGSGSAAAVDGCRLADAPPLAMVERSRMIEEVHALERIGFENHGEAYEWGPAEPGFAWTDAEPGAAALPRESPQPGGYEMRWWFPDGSDVVIDSFYFGDGGDAEDFLGLAAETSCRSGATSGGSDVPPPAKSLSWENPDGFAQEDTFVRRGRFVYRVSVVLPGVDGTVTPEGRRTGNSLTEALACTLPIVACGAEGKPI